MDVDKILNLVADKYDVPWKAVIALVEKLGITISDTIRQLIDMGWPIALKQAIGYGIIDFIWAGFFAFLSLMLMILYLPFAKRFKFGGDSTAVWWIIAVVFLALAVVLGTFGFLRLNNPAWYAIKDLLNLVQPSQ
jgi:hypothetical protein